jgi:hypothetical protein
MLSHGFQIICYRLLLLGANWVRNYLREQTNSFLAFRSMAQVHGENENYACTSHTDDVLENIGRSLQMGYA